MDVQNGAKIDNFCGVSWRPAHCETGTSPLPVAQRGLATSFLIIPKSESQKVQIPPPSPPRPKHAPLCPRPFPKPDLAQKSTTPYP